MTEQDRSTHRTADIIKEEFRSHLHSIEFGSSDYLAFCDFYALEQQKYICRIEVRNLMREMNPEEKLFAESQLRITETRIAILETEVDGKKTRDIEYSGAYKYVEHAMEELRDAISSDLASNFPETVSGKWIQIESEGVYHDILTNDLRDILFRPQQ
jgi:hypothetical protein